MDVYTFSEARQHLAKLLDRAEKIGSVRIRRRGGLTYQITPLEQKTSPLDVKGVPMGVTRDEIIAAVREGREKH